jgi:hypothetical protein
MLEKLCPLDTQTALHPSRDTHLSPTLPGSQDTVHTLEKDVPFLQMDVASCQGRGLSLY